MKILQGKEKEYTEYKNQMTDDYSARIISYSESWAELMEIEIDKIENPEEAIQKCAKAAADEADYDGITGYMYNCAVKILVCFWEYGEILRKWHNGFLGYSGTGTVNSAILNVERTKKNI